MSAQQAIHGIIQVIFKIFYMKLEIEGKNNIILSYIIFCTCKLTTK